MLSFKLAERTRSGLLDAYGFHVESLREDHWRSGDDWYPNIIFYSRTKDEQSCQSASISWFLTCLICATCHLKLYPPIELKVRFTRSPLLLLDIQSIWINAVISNLCNSLHHSRYLIWCIFFSVTKIKPRSRYTKSHRLKQVNQSWIKTTNNIIKFLISYTDFCRERIIFRRKDQVPIFIITGRFFLDHPHDNAFLLFNFCIRFCQLDQFLAQYILGGCFRRRYVSDVGGIGGRRSSALFTVDVRRSWIETWPYLFRMVVPFVPTETRLVPVGFRATGALVRETSPFHLSVHIFYHGPLFPLLNRWMVVAFVSAQTRIMLIRLVTEFTRKLRGDSWFLHYDHIWWYTTRLTLFLY